MKKILTIMCFALLLGTGCEDYLEVGPDVGLTDAAVFADYESFALRLEYANWLIHDYFYAPTDWGSEIGTLSDEGQVNTLTGPQATTFTQGNWLNNSWKGFGLTRFSFNAGNQFVQETSSSAVRAIRVANQALENFPLLTNVPPTSLYTSEQLKDQLRGQAYFLRAWHYFEIIRRYGGMFWMNRSYPVTEDFSTFERLPYSVSTDSLVADLDKAINLLPDTWDVNQKGRVTKTTARAVKAMALLYSASPSMTKFDGGAEVYNEDRARLAAIAGGEAIQSAESTGGYYAMYDWANYTENWYSKDTRIPNEAILTSPQRNGNTIGWNHGNGIYLPGFDGGWGDQYTSPTQNAADKFETIDGYAIEDAPLASHDPQDPYVNRDPRFYRAMYANGQPMYIRADASNRNLETFDGGYHHFSEGNDGPLTGYILRKFRWDGQNRQDVVGGFIRTFPLIRFAQLYLDFAEAANEAFGPTGAVPGTSLTAVDAINVVRNRATMPNVRAEYIVDKETFRERIRNERFVELFFEQHRFNDLRRWGIVEDLTDNIWGASIQQSGTSLLYGKRKLEGVRKYTEKHTWYPVPDDQLFIMTKLGQAPGW